MMRGKMGPRTSLIAVLGIAAAGLIVSPAVGGRSATRKLKPLALGDEGTTSNEAARRAGVGAPANGL